jgi:hypothetical protein
MRPALTEDSAMAKSSRPKRKRVNFGEAKRMLECVGVEHQEFGRLHPDGSHRVDPAQLEKLKKKLGKATWSRVRFVALNAPFKRRSPVSPT